MLYEGDVEFKKVIEHFSDGKYDGTSNTHVTLNKYLNAMKISGIKVKKSNGRYRMLSALSRLDLTAEDLKSLEILNEAYSYMTSSKKKEIFESFLRAIDVRLDENARALVQTSAAAIPYFPTEMLEQLKQCEAFCNDNRKLEIVYKNIDGSEINLICSPVEPVYQKRKICMKVLGNNGSRIYEIPVEDIITIKQLPVSSSGQSVPFTVVYKIKNRLAKSYKIRDWERLDKIEADGSRIIVNKNEDFNKLLSRLMRYGRECQIISPKFLKDEMADLIGKTLNNYK